MGKQGKKVGTVKSIWCYPVKSMAGQRMQHTEVEKSGIVGDRARALIERGTGKVVSAKLPSKWASVLRHRAEYVETALVGKIPSVVEITLPDGKKIFSSDRDADEQLSESIGHRCTLSHERPEEVHVDRLDPFSEREQVSDIGCYMLRNRFSDIAPIHILTTASLLKLSKESPAMVFDERRFRPNIVIETSPGHAEFLENDWIGNDIVIGDSLKLNVVSPTRRCAVPTLEQEGLPDEKGILRTILKHNRIELPFGREGKFPCLGVYTQVLDTGILRVGDVVRLVT